MPRRETADDLADAARRRLLMRKGFAASNKTGAYGASDFGKNSQVPGISAGSSQVMGV